MMRRMGVVVRRQGGIFLGSLLALGAAGACNYRTSLGENLGGSSSDAGAGNTQTDGGATEPGGGAGGKKGIAGSQGIAGTLPFGGAAGAYSGGGAAGVYAGGGAAGVYAGGGAAGVYAGGGAAGVYAGGGAAGAGLPVCNPMPGPKAGDGKNLVIDSLNDTNSNFVTAGTGAGAWDFGKDASGMGVITPPNTMSLAPVPGGQAGNALHVKGSGLTGWGAALSAFLNGFVGSFDASKYGGIAFYIKGTTEVTEGHNKVMVLARMPDVLPGPGSCCSDSVLGMECYSAHRVIIEVPEDWQEVRIKWADFRSASWGLGSTLALNPNRIRDVLFAFNHDTVFPAEPTSFDVWIDGLRFLSEDEGSSIDNSGGGGMSGIAGTAPM